MGPQLGVEGAEFRFLPESHLLEAEELCLLGSGRLGKDGLLLVEGLLPLHLGQALLLGQDLRDDSFWFRPGPGRGILSYFLRGVGCDWSGRDARRCIRFGAIKAVDHQERGRCGQWHCDAPEETGDWGG